MNGMGSANVFNARFGQTEDAYFALTHEIADVPATSSIGTAWSTRCW